MSVLKIATLFSGVGTPEQSLKHLKINHETIFACEIDKYARQTYLANNQEPNTFYEDVYNIDGKKYLNQIDILVGGSPCQSFSIAGKRLGVECPRGNLIYEYFRIVEESKPKVFIYENVKGFLSIDKGETFKNFVQSFSNIVYVALDITHLKKYEEKFLKNSYQFSSIGILIYDNKKLTLYKKAYRHKEIAMLYSLLKSEEIAIFFNKFKGKSLIPKNYQTMQHILEDIFTYREIYEISKHIFITRFRDEVQDFPKTIFKDFELTHKRFQEWLNEENWIMVKPIGSCPWIKKDKKQKTKRNRLKCLEEYKLN